MAKTYRDKHRGYVKFFERNLPKETFQWGYGYNPEYAAVRQEWCDLWSFHNKNTWRYHAQGVRYNSERAYFKVEKLKLIEKEFDKELRDFINYDLYNFMMVEDDDLIIEKPIQSKKKKKMKKIMNFLLKRKKKEPYKCQCQQGKVAPDKGSCPLSNS